MRVFRQDGPRTGRHRRYRHCHDRSVHRTVLLHPVYHLKTQQGLVHPMGGQDPAFVFPIPVALLRVFPF